MNAPKQVPAAPVPRFPHDLRLWMDEDRLLHRVLEAASSLAATGPSRVFQHGTEQFSFGQMLATVSFAYLTDRYGSDEVAEALETDPALRYLSVGRFVDSAAIRRFRRLHRGPLGVVLLRVLQASLAEQCGKRRRSATDRDASPEAGTNWDDVDVLSRSALEAEARLARAVFADTMALDF